MEGRGGVNMDGTAGSKGPCHRECRSVLELGVSGKIYEVDKHRVSSEQELLIALQILRTVS